MILLNVGTVINKAGATISAYSDSYAAGVDAFGAPATVLNSGSIVSNGDGVNFMPAAW